MVRLSTALVEASEAAAVTRAAAGPLAYDPDRVLRDAQAGTAPRRRRPARRRARACGRPARRATRAAVHRRAPADGIAGHAPSAACVALGTGTSRSLPPPSATTG